MRGADRVRGIPLAITQPLTITVMRSAMRNTASMSCSTSAGWRGPRAVRRAAPACARSPRRPCRPAARRAAAPGAVARHIAISSWRFWPWSSAGGRSSVGPRPAFAAASRGADAPRRSAARRATRPRVAAAACAARRQFSNTLNSGRWCCAGSCGRGRRARAWLRPARHVFAQQFDAAARGRDSPDRMLISVALAGAVGADHRMHAAARSSSMETFVHRHQPPQRRDGRRAAARAFALGFTRLAPPTTAFGCAHQPFAPCEGRPTSPRGSSARWR